jgi:hypothetical protein
LVARYARRFASFDLPNRSQTHQSRLQQLSARQLSCASILRAGAVKMNQGGTRKVEDVT